MLLLGIIIIIIFASPLTFFLMGIHLFVPFCFCILSHVQISIGYFLSDLVMILWHFPALGGLEYVSR